MTVTYCVFYQGEAENKEAFIEHYRHTHVPILKQLPGIQSISLLVPEACEDPYPIQPGNFVLIAQMLFNSVEELERALGSEARKRARQDFVEFLPFEGKIWHQAMRIETTECLPE